MSEAPLVAPNSRDEVLEKIQQAQSIAWANKYEVADSHFHHAFLNVLKSYFSLDDKSLATLLAAITPEQRAQLEEELASRCRKRLRISYYIYAGASLVVAGMGIFIGPLWLLSYIVIGGSSIPVYTDVYEGELNFLSHRRKKNRFLRDLLEKAKPVQKEIGT